MAGRKARYAASDNPNEALDYKRKAKALSPRDIRSILPLTVVQPPVRQSNAGHFVQCPRYYLLRDMVGLVPKGTYHSAPEIGVLYHGLMESYVRGLPKQERDDRFNSAVAQAVADARDWGVETGNMKKADDTCRTIEKDGLVAYAMAEYTWAKAPLNLKRFTPILTEVSLEAEVPGLGVTTKGIVDLLLWDSQSKGYWLYDYKSTSRDLGAILPTLGFDFQARIYRVLVEEALEAGLGLPNGDVATRAPVRGFAWGYIKVPTIRLKRDQTVEDYCEEVREWYEATGRHEDKKAERVMEPVCQTGTMAFTGERYDAELMYVYRMMKEANARTPTLDNFPRLGKLHGMCSGRFGRPCEFLDLCGSPPSEWAQKVLKSYKVERHDE